MKENAKQTLALVEAGTYTAEDGTPVSIADAQAAALAGTRLYTPDQLAALVDGLSEDGGPAPPVEVVDGTTQRAAQRLAAEGPVVLLNFASGRNPGGGFLNGARAQEEDLCRCSGLYPTLLTQWTYYEANRARSSTDYTDHAIFSPAVPFFRLSGRSPLLSEPFLASVITMPAPNVVSRKNPRLKLPVVVETFGRRWRQVLAIAADTGHRRVLLGAWGCGAFGNDARRVAATARQALADPRFAGRFDHVEFAIPDTGKVSRANLAAFREALE